MFEWKFRVLKMILLISLLAAPLVLFAQTFYVSQSPSAILYDEPNEQSTLLQQLPTNTPIELLKSNLENGFSYVKTNKGNKGWVHTDDLSETVQENKPGFFSHLFGKFTSTTADIIDKKPSDASLHTSPVVKTMLPKKTLSTEPATITDTTVPTPLPTAPSSSNGNENPDANLALSFQQMRMNYKLMLFNKSQILSLDAEVKDLQSQIEKLRYSGKINSWYWFVAGAGTMLLGLLFGLMIGGWRRGRNDGWYVKG